MNFTKAIVRLPASNFASTFVEDVAILTEHAAIMTLPGAASRITVCG